MCPVCMTTAAVTVTSATSVGGGFVALVVKIFRKKNIAAQLTASRKGACGVRTIDSSAICFACGFRSVILIQRVVFALPVQC